MSARLVGRDSALAMTGQALAGASGAAGRLLLVSGEPGIGKTALVRALAEDATRAGARVAWAACPPGGGAPAYWPWTQVVRDLAGTRDLAPAALSLLAAGDHPPVDSADRFELYDGVARALADPDRHITTVVVLDDLHWADVPSLDLLDFVARGLGGQPVLVVGTYRDVGAPPRLDRIAASADGITLGGIDVASVIDLVTTITATAPSPAEAEHLRHRTGGNPLFVRELARLLVADGPGRSRAAGLPGTVAETLTERLDRLEPTCVDLLAVAAVADSADPGLLSRVARIDHDTVTTLLSEAFVARVLTASPADERPFVHDLFREAVLARQSPARRRDLERAVADALIAAGAAPGRIAAHLAASLPRPADPAAARLTVAWLTTAAVEATARLGHEEAVRQYQRAVELSPSPPVELLTRLAEAQVRAGDPEAPSTYRRAAEAARSDADAGGLAAVALGFHRIGARGDHGAQRSLLEEAIAAVPGESLTRALLLAALARDRRHDYSDGEDPRGPAEEAVAIARIHRDPRVLAECLLALHDAVWAPGTAASRLELVEEMASAAAAAGDAELVAQATVLRAACLLTLNDPRGLADLLAYCRQQEDFGHARGRWEAASRRATWELITGAPDEALAHCEEALVLGQRIGIPDAFGVNGTLRWPLSLFVGTRTEVIERMIGIEIDHLRDCFVAAAHRADGDPAVARAVASKVAWPVPEPAAVDLEFAALGADALAASADGDQVRACYADLLPHAGTNVLVGGCASFWGPVDLYLGELAARLGDRAAALRHLRDAEAMATTLGAPLWAAHARRLATALTPSGAGPQLVRDGRVWRVAFDGTEAHVADAKGVADLAVLLARAGVEVAATELMSGRPVASAAPVLDTRAKTAYRRRLELLDAEIGDAEIAGDDGRSERARLERAALLKELSAAVGLGGRDRRLGDDQERARKAVTARIREAIDRIGEAHPALGAHLAATVHTGAWCSYRL